MPKYSKGHIKATFVSDRSGLTFPRSEMVVEPGTKLIVARCESDGRWNRVDHPQNKAPRWNTPEGIGYKYPRPEVGDYSDEYILLEANQGNTNSAVYNPGTGISILTEEGGVIRIEGYDS
jgi:hypothetical protein